MLILHLITKQLTLISRIKNCISCIFLHLMIRLRWKTSIRQTIIEDIIRCLQSIIIINLNLFSITLLSIILQQFSGHRSGAAEGDCTVSPVWLASLKSAGLLLLVAGLHACLPAWLAAAVVVHWEEHMYLQLHRQKSPSVLEMHLACRLQSAFTAIFSCSYNW